MSDIWSVLIPHTVMGVGAISSIGDLVNKFAASNVLVITDPGVAKAGIIDAIKPPLEKSGVKFEVCDECCETPPISFTDELSRKVKAGNYDLLIGVGGGSVMDATKVVGMIALNELGVWDLIRRTQETGNANVGGKLLPKILVPTTAGTGAEWSRVATAYDRTSGQEKVYMIRADETLPNAVVLDPELTRKLPQSVTVATGMDALTHAIEAFTSCRANAFSDVFAGGAIRMVSENLRVAYAKGDSNIEARVNMSVAAAMAMNAANCASVGLVHLMLEPVVIKTGAAHGHIVGLLLPYVMEYNLLGNPAKFAKVAELMGENIAGLSVWDAAARSVEAVRRLSRDLGMPQRLREIGVVEADIPLLAERVMAANGPRIGFMNPRDAAGKDVAGIYAAALGV